MSAPLKTYEGPVGNADHPFINLLREVKEGSGEYRKMILGARKSATGSSLLRGVADLDKVEDKRGVDPKFLRLAKSSTGAVKGDTIDKIIAGKYVPDEIEIAQMQQDFGLDGELRERFGKLGAAYIRECAREPSEEKPMAAHTLQMGHVEQQLQRRKNQIETVTHTQAALQELMDKCGAKNGVRIIYRREPGVTYKPITPSMLRMNYDVNDQGTALLKGQRPKKARDEKMQEQETQLDLSNIKVITQLLHASDAEVQAVKEAYARDLIQMQSGKSKAKPSQGRAS